jgi:hypothetical protein
MTSVLVGDDDGPDYFACAAKRDELLALV